jgi:hypothetical protein
MDYPENMDFELSLPAVEATKSYPWESFLKDLFKIDQTAREGPRSSGFLSSSKRIIIPIFQGSGHTT